MKVIIEDDRCVLLHGDSRRLGEVVPAEYVDAIVCDPPYDLGFMGKGWDKSGIAFDAEFWRAMLALLKPGGHLLAFGGTRTYHRMACAIEDAGFEIRDSIHWFTGQGFPKSLDLAYELHTKAASLAEHDLRFVQSTYLSTPVYSCHQCRQVLLACMSEQSAQAHWRAWREPEVTGAQQPCLEGWSYAETIARELPRCSICSMSHGILDDGANGRLHHGASSGDGSVSWTSAVENGSGASHEPQSVGQQDREFDAVLIERRAQALRGTGTALKPAHEPIILARRPLDGTYAENVLAHGVGGINVDGCRIGSEVRFNPPAGNDGTSPASIAPVNVTGYQGVVVVGRWPANVVLSHADGCEVVGEREASRQVFHNVDGEYDREGTVYDGGWGKQRASTTTTTTTIWQCVDGCPVAELDRQSDIKRAAKPERGRRGKRPGGFGDVGADRGDPAPNGPQYGDIGGASRFFATFEVGGPPFMYCAKPSSRERDAGLDHLPTKTRAEATNREEGSVGSQHARAGAGSRLGRRNTHATVKPIALMRWLCRLVTPPGGKVLDPFAGSGTTGVAALQEKFQFIGCELGGDNGEHIPIVEGRLRHALKESK